LLGDKAYSCEPVESALKELGVALMPARKKNQKKQWFIYQERFIKKHRRQIETSFSILTDVMGLNRLKAITLDGFILKTHAAVLALIFHITLTLS
jgi:hypothetical protein